MDFTLYNMDFMLQNMDYINPWICDDLQGIIHQGDVSTLCHTIPCFHDTEKDGFLKTLL